ncbi:MAG: hypothetical protein JKY96_00840 [Phycisphaerales bacterium]|nr:hypothetical protein [Phycisphaerales bacterium]
MRTTHALAIASAATIGLAAHADLVSTFGFTDLNANYNGLVFSALSQGALPTGGDITDYSAPGFQTASFESGFIGVQSITDVLFQMDIGNITATTADGTNGRIVIRDNDGDVLSGSFNGTWDLRFGFGFFDGEITFAQYNDAGNGIFEGTTNLDSFETPDGTYIGAISFLVQMPEWFSDAAVIENLSAQGDGILVTPSPASIALLGLGGLVASRRRR